MNDLHLGYIEKFLHKHCVKSEESYHCYHIG
jgi:hypothetical protein